MSNFKDKLRELIGKEIHVRVEGSDLLECVLKDVHEDYVVVTHGEVPTRLIPFSKISFIQV